MSRTRAVANAYPVLVVLLGVAAGVRGWADLQVDNWPRFVCFLAVGVATSLWKVRLPGVEATMSMNFLLLLGAIAVMSPPEAVLIGAASAIVQTLWRTSRAPKLIQHLFNAATLTLAVSAASAVYHSTLAHWTGSVAFRLPLAGGAYFLVNTSLVAVIVALTGGKRPFTVWRETYLWAIPHYFVGSTIACAVWVVDNLAGWQFSLLVLPSVYLIYRSYQVYVDRIESERHHAQAVSEVQLRTIEALALAIELKDETTYDHLRRVQTYALEIGKELGLSDAELEALHAGALLHDIGKVGIPEYIISKPGKLTPDEFNLMKTHTVIGAEILAQVAFPHPVVPIVRGHHERWDGSGYPDGLAGEAIPLGARIVGAVDTLDALASERQYRRAMPLEEAVAYVVKEAGRSFDPRVTAVIARKFRDMEALTRASSDRPRLSGNLQVERGAAPAAGFESAATGTGEFTSSVHHLAEATADTVRLFDLARENGLPMSGAEALALSCQRLGECIPHDGAVVWAARGRSVEPVYCTGADAPLFADLRIPRGEGVSGWVVEHGRAILNGNPAVESAYLHDQSRCPQLGSALSVPIERDGAIAGALTLYRRDPDAFQRADLPSLESIAPKLAGLLSAAATVA